MIMYSDKASKKLRDLIEYYNISYCEGIPGDNIPTVEVPLDKYDIMALRMAIKALNSLEPFSFIDSDDGEPITETGKIRKDAKKIMEEGDPDAN